jgi:uncharacterized protein DUF6817
VTTALEFLRGTVAPELPHPGGTLLAHLVRVHDWLEELGAPPHVCRAGLTHAVYGTDGFDVTLIELGERSVLEDMIGTDAELLVYRYGACDRARTWRGLASTGVVRNRFTGSSEPLTGAELTEFADLTVINELDVLAHSAEIEQRHGDSLRALFLRWQPILSPAVAKAAGQ